MRFSSHPERYLRTNVPLSIVILNFQLLQLIPVCLLINHSSTCFVSAPLCSSRCCSLTGHCLTSHCLAITSELFFLHRCLDRALFLVFQVIIQNLASFRGALLLLFHGKEHTPYTTSFPPSGFSCFYFNP